MFKTIVTSAFLLAAALPVKAQVGSGLGVTDYVNHSSSQATYAQVCTRSGNGRLSLRMGPGTNFGKIKEIPNGHTVALSSGKYASDGFYWWNIYHNGSQGWVRSDYVCGDPQ